MEKFFTAYIDQAVVITALALTILFTYRQVKTAVLPVRVLPLFFLLFGPAIISCAMAGHIFEIGYRAAKNAFAGDFTFTYHFYSLMLIGVVFLAMGGYMLQQTGTWLSGQRQGKINFIKTAVVLSLLSLPTCFFAPIGLLPTAASIISFVAMPFAVKPVPQKEYILQKA